MAVRPARSTEVLVFTKKECAHCEALANTVLPVIRGIFESRNSPLADAGIRLRVVADSEAPQYRVTGFPTILFRQDGEVVKRHTIEGFPSDHDDLQAFGEWFGRYVVAAHYRDV